MDIYFEAEKELAELLGWEGIVYNAIYNQWWGQKDGCPDTFVPRWSKVDGQAFRLMVEYNVNLTFVEDWGISACIEGDVSGITHYISDHPDKFTAVRFAIVQAVIAKLKSQRSN